MNVPFTTRRKSFVAAKVGNGVALHAYYGRTNLGRRIENARLYGEKVFYVIPSLQQYAQYAVVFLSRGEARRKATSR